MSKRKFVPKHNKRSIKQDWKKPREENEGFKRKLVVKDDSQLYSFRESQVGITEFVTSSVGFTGVVKSRFSDFHVNEIDLNGKILQLNDLTIPQQVEEFLSNDEVIEAQNELQNEITPEIWLQIKNLAEMKTMGHIEINVNDWDKDRRTQLHKVLKKLYAGKLVSTTTNVGETKFIKIMKAKGRSDQNRKRWTFPGEFVHFILYKENWDTSDVVTTIADRLNLRPTQVNYCGTKDRRAKTTQKFCIKHREPSQIVRAVKAMHTVHVGNFEFSKDVLKLGDLKGNRFRIALRHVSGDQNVIEDCVQKLRDNGFINYYGLQRFGNCASVPTYEVGVALLKSDYKGACELILKPRENDSTFMKEVRKVWWENRDSAKAAAMFRGGKNIEKRLLDGLARSGRNDYATALRTLPRNMLLLYPHAFQSLVFNRIASRRIKEFGLQLIVGDLVYRSKDEEYKDIMDELAIEDETNSKEEKWLATENKIEEIKNDTKATDESEYKRKVRALTEEDIACGNYTLFDIVLPLPGYDVTYPENCIKNWYEDILGEYGLTSEKMRHNVKTFAMGGTYRKLLIKPIDMSWEFCSYDSIESSLIKSDWELLKEKEEKSPPPLNGEKGKFRALLLDFCLPASTYATMLLRELLKADTSAAYQKHLEQNALREATEDKVESEEKLTENTATQTKDPQNAEHGSGNKEPLKKIIVTETEDISTQGDDPEIAEGKSENKERSLEKRKVTGTEDSSAQGEEPENKKQKSTPNGGESVC